MADIRLHRLTPPTPRGGQSATLPQPLSRNLSRMRDIHVARCFCGTPVAAARRLTDSHMREGGIDRKGRGVRSKFSMRDVVYEYSGYTTTTLREDILLNQT